MVGISRCVLPPLQGSWPVRSGAVLRVTQKRSQKRQHNAPHATCRPSMGRPLTPLPLAPWRFWGRPHGRPVRCVARACASRGTYPLGRTTKALLAACIFWPVGTPRRMHSARHQARHSADSSPHQHMTDQANAAEARTVQQIRSSERGTSVCRVTHGRCRFVSFQ